MRDTIAHCIDKLSPTMFAFFYSMIFMCGLSHLDKEKFPFSWRKVWGVFFLYLACTFFLFRAVQLIKTS